MAKHPNLVSARAGYEAFAVGAMAAVGDLLADDNVWHSGGNNILTGDYEGKEAVFGYFARLLEETGGTFRNEIRDMLANDDHGVALVDFSATRGDTSLDGSVVHVFHMRDGKMTEFWSISQDQAQFDEFWA